MFYLFNKEEILITLQISKDDNMIVAKDNDCFMRMLHEIYNNHPEKILISAQTASEIRLEAILIVFHFLFKYDANVYNLKQSTKEENQTMKNQQADINNIVVNDKEDIDYYKNIINIITAKLKHCGEDSKEKQFYQEAIGYYSLSQKTDFDPKICFELAVIYYLKKNYNQAIFQYVELYKNNTNRDISNRDIFLHLGHALLDKKEENQKQFQLTINAYKKTLRENHYAIWRFMYGVTKYEDLCIKAGEAYIGNLKDKIIHQEDAKTEDKIEVLTKEHESIIKRLKDQEEFVEKENKDLKNKIKTLENKIKDKEREEKYSWKNIQKHNTSRTSYGEHEELTNKFKKAQEKLKQIEKVLTVKENDLSVAYIKITELENRNENKQNIIDELNKTVDNQKRQIQELNRTAKFQPKEIQNISAENMKYNMFLEEDRKRLLKIIASMNKAALEEGVDLQEKVKELRKYSF